MSQADNTPKVDLSKLRQSDIEFMKLIEKENLLRVQKLKVLRKRNLITGLIVGATALSIYGYSIFAVKQETFLDDFNEPAKTTY